MSISFNLVGRGVATAAVVGTALLAAPAAALAQPAQTQPAQTQPAHTPPAPACHRYHPATALTVADNGERLCVRRGQRISVRLSVDPQQFPDPGQWWTPIVETGRAIEARPQRFLPVRGTTVGLYQAVGRGRATLTATRAVCPPNPSGPTCGSIQGWQVTVVVG
jgi:hypothetical protein